jgi:hypothetical protein
MTQVAYGFVRNLGDEAMHPWRIAYDAAFGTLGTLAIDATGLDSVIYNISNTFDLAPQRSQQLAAGLTFATLNALERGTMKTLGKSMY